MKKKIIWLVSLSVLVIAGIALYNYYQRYFLVDADYPKGLALVKQEIKKQTAPGKAYRYTYYSIWNLKCAPCIEEMPELDSIVGRLAARIQCVFVSNNKQEDVVALLGRKKLDIRHFIYVNDMNYFISAVHKKVNNRNFGYPTHVITDSLDNIIYFSQGTLRKLYSLDELKMPEEDKKRFRESLKDPLVKKLESLD